MKLIRFGERNKERPGLLLDDGTRKDLSSHFTDWNRDFFNNNGLAALHDLAENAPELPDAPADARLGAPVARPGKVICIGLNYRDHAEESGMAVPDEPVVFMKAPNTVCGPEDPVIIPRGSEKTDWEVELGVVIGRDSRYLADRAAAKAAIAGYCISHDVSERAFQLERGGQWCKGKSSDNFNPLGPFLATAEAVADPQNLNLTLSVNGEQVQSGNTRTMVFDVLHVVHYLSQFMTLEAGDVISTGTPPGVGLGMKPPRFLKAGDVCELRIDGLGSQRAECVDA
jgi:2,4-didehydro-3-deoxy-L-rhamnonate hydrolase